MLLLKVKAWYLEDSRTCGDRNLYDPQRMEAWHPTHGGCVAMQRAC